MIEGSDIEKDSPLQTYLREGLLPVTDDSGSFDDFDDSDDSDNSDDSDGPDDSDDSDDSNDSEDSDDSDDSNIKNEPLLQTPPHERWRPVMEDPDTETTPAV